jgi:hypothetical protein
MKFMKSVHAAATLGGIFAPKDLDVNSKSKSVARCPSSKNRDANRFVAGSIRNVAATLAYETMTYYSGNTTDPNTRVSIPIKTYE